MLKVKEYLTKENKEDLTSFGFSHGGNTYYKEYHNGFNVILNPTIISDFKNYICGKVVINYLDEDNIGEVNTLCDMTEIYFDIELLIESGIIIKE